MGTALHSGNVLDLLAAVSSSRQGAPTVACNLRDLVSLLNSDLAKVEALLLDSPPGADPRCAAAASDLVGSGGKRLRPALCLLTCRIASACHRAPRAVLLLASAVELLHTATLLHDDVIDDATLRRGRPCARTSWGNAVSVIAGDLLLVQALDRVHAIGDSRVDTLTDRTLLQLVEGEVDQLQRRGTIEFDEQQFEAIASRKTASLFVLAAVGGALLGGADAAQAAAVEKMAVATGLAFQLDDDLLDLCSTAEALGKAVGQDLATGSVTLPLAELLRQTPHLREQVKDHLEQGAGPLPVALSEQILRSARIPAVLERCRRRVGDHVRDALQATARLRPCQERDVLEGLIRMLTARSMGATQPEEATRSQA